MRWDLGMAAAVMFSINIFLWMGQVSIDNINPGGTQFYNYDGSIISKYDAGGFTLNESIDGKLPEAHSSVDPDTQNFYTDLFSTLKSWFLGLPGIDFLLGVLNGVPNLLKSIGMPNEFAYALGVFWHAIALLLVISFLRGG